MKKNPDTGQTIAIGAGLAAVGVGFYYWYQEQLKPPPATGWIKLATKQLTVNVSETFGWIPLATKTLNVKASTTFGWVPLATKQLTVGVSTAFGWVKLANTTLDVKVNTTFGWIPLAKTSLDVDVKSIVNIGFIISLMAGEYWNAEYWYADIDEKYYALFLGMTELWQGEWDIGPSYTGLLTVELYDIDYIRIGVRKITVTIKNGYAYEFYFATNKFVEIGKF